MRGFLETYVQATLYVVGVGPPSIRRNLPAVVNGRQSFFPAMNAAPEEPSHMTPKYWRKPDVTGGAASLALRIADSRKEHSGPGWWMRRAVLWTPGAIGHIVPERQP